MSYSIHDFPIQSVFIKTDIETHETFISQRLQLIHVVPHFVVDLQVQLGFSSLSLSDIFPRFFWKIKFSLVDEIDLTMPKKQKNCPKLTNNIINKKQKQIKSNTA